MAKALKEELARYIARRKQETIDGGCVQKIETKMLGQDRVQYIRIIFEDGSVLSFHPDGEEMLAKVFCSGVYSDREGLPH
jgi:hypothetical protein